MMRLKITALALLTLAVWVGLAVVVKERAHANYVNYLAAGDSITVGAGTTGCTQVTGQCPHSYSGVIAVNGYGVGGGCIVECDDAHNIRVWLPAHLRGLDTLPSVVVVNVGTNDYPLREPVEIINEMKNLAASLDRQFGIRVVYGTITPAPPFSCGCPGAYWNIGQSGHGKATRLEVNDWLRDNPLFLGPEYARALQCGAQDLCPQFMSVYQDPHPNDAGAAVMGEVLRSWMEADR